MKKKLLSLGLSILFGGFSLQSQNDLQVLQKHAVNKYTPTHTLTPPSMDEIKAEDLERDRNGMFYRIGVASSANISPTSSGLWTTLPNGDKLWQLKVKATGAEALSFLFSTFKLYDNASFWVQDMQGKALYRKLTKSDVQDHFQQHVELCFGDEMVLNLLEPAGAQASEFYLDQIMYDYRSTGNPNVNKINESEACQVNVNCTPVGDNWQDEKRGVARILVVDGADQGWCSGTLINNTSQDCKPYFLTALHCGVTSTTANFNQWKFYFRYEAPNCTSPTAEGTLDDYFITGCVKKASSNDGGGDTGSDFLLVQLGSETNEAATITTLKSANFNAYWNGWDANNTASNSGVGIHHPAGDIKKISAYTTNTTTAGWNGNGLQSHWRMVWSATTNGHGVTEGGSSGSPLFNYNGGSSRVIGTLTGGSSFCDATSDPDYYGKMSYHWQSNITSGNIPLKTFLDPGNTGSLVLDGSSNPCAVVSAPPVANFSGTPATVASGGTVTFSDLSTNAPTSWAWTISGTAGTNWSYTGGTSATSQNPQVIFTTVGQYTVTLTAINGFGSDGETKTNYITVTAAASGPCAATSTACTDESINNVTLGTINNTTACTNYGNYTNQSTVLIKGQSYTATIVPQAQGVVGSAYANDEIAIYIDYNNNNSFTDAGERVGYVLVATGWSNQFTFTVPTSATVGTLRMRCRISYSTDEGPIDPCGTTADGEVEDYSVVVQAASVASVAITSSDADNVICAGTSVTFTASPVNGGASPSYLWKINGAPVGTNSAIFTTSILTNGQIVTCVMTSNLVGVSGSPATSNSMTMSVNATPSTPAITVGSNGITLTSSSATGNQWYKNGVLIVGAINQSYTTSSDGNYSVIVTVNSCSSAASANTLISSASIADLSTEGLNLVIYPNPSNGKFNISYTTSDVDQVKIELQNVLGQIVYIDQLTELNGKFSKEVDLSKFGQGEYFLRVTDSKSNIVRKVVIY